jgi:hypothetical protein
MASCDTLFVIGETGFVVRVVVAVWMWLVAWID